MPERFGRYELLGPIGRGGMAELFRARLSVPGGAEKLLVVKRILSRFSGDPEFLKMFVNEARIALPAISSRHARAASSWPRWPRSRWMRSSNGVSVPRAASVDNAT